MEKSQNIQDNTKTISFVLDTRGITSKPIPLILKANDKELSELEKEYDINRILKLSVEGKIFEKDGFFHFDATLKAVMKRNCVVSSEEFEQKMNTNFTVLFTTNQTLANEQNKRADEDIMQEPAEFIPNNQIFFKNVIMEQFCLALDPFPRKTDEIFTYFEEKAEDVKENPFSVLKHLTK